MEPTPRPAKAGTFEHRSILCLSLAAGLSAALVVSAAGCGSSANVPSRATAATAPATTPTANGALTALVGCLNSHGMTISAGATPKQIKAEFKALPTEQEQSVFGACSSLLPSKLRQKLQAFIAKGMPTTTTSP